jgi:hypothetical protein
LHAFSNFFIYFASPRCCWYADEDRITNDELKSLGDLINEIERHVSRSVIEGDGGAGLLAVATARRKEV